MTNLSISELMMKHHYNIDKILGKFTKELKEKSILNMGTFNKFKWELEKHFFMEEKAIFQLHYSNNEKTNTITTQLKSEHDHMIAELEKIEANIKLGKSFNFTDLRKMIIDHKNYENREFYPLLDDELEDDRKELIIQRLSNTF